MSYKTKKLQVRLTEDESARLDRIVTWMNEPDRYEAKQKRRELLNLSYSWGQVTVSDVLRFLVNSNQVDVLHKRISKRTTKSSR